MSREDTRQKIYPWIMVVCCCGLIVGPLGFSVNCAGLFFHPIALELGTGIGQVTLFSTIVNLAGGIAGPAAVWLSGKIPLRRLLGIASALMTGSYLLLSVIRTLPQMYLAGILLGICNAVCGMVMVTHILSFWFHAKNGLALGIAMSFSGVAAAVMNPLFLSVIEGSGWRSAYRMAAVLIWVASIPACCFLRLNPEEMGLHALEEKGQPVKSLPGGKVISNRKNTCLRIGFYSCTGAVLTAMAAHISSYAESIKLSAAALSVILSVIMLCNSAYKLISGVLCDQIGSIRTARLTMILSAIGILGLLWLQPEQLWKMVLTGILIGPAYSAGGVIAASMLKECNEAEMMGSVYSKIAMAGFIANALSYSWIGFLYDISGAYSGAIGISVFLAVAAAFLISHK